MERFKLVITGEVPTEKAQAFHDSIPTLVRHMRGADIDVERATTYPGGVTHHDHQDADVDVEWTSPSVKIESRAGRHEVDGARYAKALEDELARLATAMIDRGVAIGDGESVVDVVLRELGRGVVAAAAVDAKTAPVSLELDTTQLAPPPVSTPASATRTDDA